MEQQALKEHLGRQKRQLKRDKEILKEANVPFTEINDQFVGFTPTTGGINLMIEKSLKRKLVRLFRYHRTIHIRMDSGHPSRKQRMKTTSTSTEKQRKLSRL